METQLNVASPTIMYIDINSCFATIKQQAYSHLRNKPVVIAAYTTPAGCILSPSIEAKRLGIKTGMRVREAKAICPNVIVCESDPDLIRDVSKKFNNICGDYSPDVSPKSIDEVMIDFKNVPTNKNLIEIGREIKRRIKNEIGEWIVCSIGISTNRFLSKLASSLHKPDGLDMIDYRNIRQVYSSVKLTDLNGINIRFQSRLNSAGISSPLQFLDTNEEVLRKQVFKSIVGHYWYWQLRGYEVDWLNDTKRKSFGQEYSLGEKTSDQEKLAAIIMMLCEKMGRRLRQSGLVAYGVHLGLTYNDWGFWHMGEKFSECSYTTREFFSRAMSIFKKQPFKKIVSKVSVSCYDLKEKADVPVGLFDEGLDRKRSVSDAVDRINDKYGEYVITPALMIKTKKTVLDRIAFGGLKSQRLVNEN